MASQPGPSGGANTGASAAAPAAAARSNLGAQLRTAATDGDLPVGAGGAGGTSTKSKKKKHRAGKKKKKKGSSQIAGQNAGSTTNGLEHPSINVETPSFYQPYRPEAALSTTSLESDALLDHREHTLIRPRRNSRAAQAFMQTSLSSSLYRRRQSRQTDENALDDDRGDDPRAPLLAYTHSPNTVRAHDYGGIQSSRSSMSSGRRPQTNNGPEYDVNNPPSMPGSPVLDVATPFGDVLEGGLDDRSSRAGDFVIDVDGGPSPRTNSPDASRNVERRHTFSGPPEDDVCFPHADISEWASELPEEEYLQRQQNGEGRGRPRRRRRRWPNFEVLDEWAHEERAQKKNEQLQAKKVREPQYVDGRLRPRLQQLLFQEPDEVNRFTYFNEQFEATIHASCISELVPEGQTFKDLFAPEPPVLSESESESEDGDQTATIARKPSGIMSETRSETSPGDASRVTTRQSSVIDAQITGNSSVKDPTDRSGGLTPIHEGSHQDAGRVRYGNPPAFWLDIMCPTDAEMKLLTHVFNLHPLTAEDILMRESREKVELFRHYYFVSYRAFDQDPNSTDYMDPVNFYIIVFKEGIITFHFAPTPHPAHVRRRIRTLNDYVPIDSDWLCYALIDSITDAYQPVVESIEEKVDEIDDAILEMHEGKSDSESGDESIDEKASVKSREQGKKMLGGSMLKRVGKIRKKTMNLGRLLSTKADVIKQFAKRCTERYDVAPRSDIGLFLGDIQDHIITMQSSLSHYEMMLARAHSNYLAQISFRMNQRQEETSGSLNKLTVLGTIVLPMNIITGMWGMNVLVPGQEVDNLYWFFGITAGLFVFGSLCYFVAKKSKIV